MSDPQDFDETNEHRRNGVHPRSGKRPIPTVQGYREHRRELRGQLEETQEAQKGPEDDSKPRRALHSIRAIFKDEDMRGSNHNPYPASNHNYARRPVDEGQVDEGQVDQEDEDPGRESVSYEDTRPSTSQSRAGEQGGEQAGHDRENQGEAENRGKGEHRDKGKGKGPKPSGTEAVAGALDPKQKRKAMKKAKRDTGGREVTDPVTHLPIVIHDQTDKDLRNAPQNVPEPGTDHLTATGLQGASKSEDELQSEQAHLQKGYVGMKKMFPPPDFEDMRQELGLVYNRAVKGGLAIIGAAAAIFLGFPSFRGQPSSSMCSLLGFASFVATAFGVAIGMGKWMDKKANEIFEDETWDAARREENETLDTGTELPESVQWFNRLVSCIWPLVNPDLFSSVIDQIEDIMQASLPKFIKMVSIDDMGQGNESVRILGVRWLPSGAASMTMESDGQLKKPDAKASSDRTNPEDGQQSDETSASGNEAEVEGKEEEEEEEEEGEKPKEENDEEMAIREGMEAEEGDFVNLELAVSYRSRSSGKGIRSKAKNAHLLLKFYLPGGIPVPIWVEVRGFVAILRLRLQLTPDPPFVSLCTLTFLGQPRARISCVPISKHSVNMLDIPVISSFVQSAIDAAMAEYVAPKSLTLNLKDMLVGADFKKDTISRGMVWIYIKQARGFKQGDGGIGPIEGSSDSYVTCSWGKFGKPVASTRVIESSQEPNWHEYASILVTPEELNAEEKLRLQLWDSDKWTADDDLGRVQVNLKELMSNPESYNKMQDREDGFTGQDSSEKMAGSLVWSVGYFDKAKITPAQLEKQTVLPEIKTKEQLKQHVSDTAERKLREANKSPENEEIKQQKAQDYQALENDMICSAPPDPELPSGILSVVIKNITGLGIQKLNKADSEDKEDEAQQDDDMPDGYCTIIMNHKKIYRTRTKPKNSKPFFNAGTERFVRDWRETEVIISVRDAREREADPLIGIVYLPLSKVLAGKSQVMENYPLIGGVGYGRARVSLVWRSVDLKLPLHLRGWDYGTLEVRGAVKAKQGLPDSLKGHRIKIRTNMGRCKLYPENGEWEQKKGNESSFLAVRKRYASALVVEFRENSFGPDRTPAFAVFWLQDLVDEEVETKTIKVWKGGKANQARAESCAAYNGMEEGEEPLGEVELSVVFWRGLSGYHKSYAAEAKSDDMRQVMECLDTVTDQNLGDDFEDDSDSDSDESGEQDPDTAAKKKLQVHTNDDSSMDEESDGGSDDGSSSNPSLSDLKKAKKVKKILRNPVDGGIETLTSILAPGHIDENDSSRGLRNQLRDYKDHKNQLHRKHKGIMQWRVAREADYLGGKLGKLGHVSRLFKHGSKASGIETEV